MAYDFGRDNLAIGTSVNITDADKVVQKDYETTLVRTYDVDDYVINVYQVPRRNFYGIRHVTVDVKGIWS